MQLPSASERDLGGSRDQGEVAAPRADLVKAGADPARRPHREADLGERPAAGAAVIIGPR